MNRKDILISYNQINNHLINNKIIKAIKALRKNINTRTDDVLLSSLENIETTYSLVLDYAIRGVKDPKRTEIYNKLVKSLLELNDRTKNQLLDAQFSQFYHQKKSILSKSTYFHHKIKEISEHASVSDELSNLLEGMKIEKPADEQVDMHAVIEELFLYVWFTEMLSDADIEMLKLMFESDVFTTQHKDLIVSSLTLGLLDNFDARKLIWLAEMMINSNFQSRERVFAGLMFALYKYDYRLHFYPEIENILKTLALNSEIKSFSEFLLIQLIKAKDTEKFTKKLRDEIMPDIIKHAPKIQERLDLDNILPEDEDKNPNWESILEDAPDLMKKLEELSRLQLEGTDVFMGTFAMLKNFPFFHKASNWFMPFYPENPEISTVLDYEGDDFKRTFLHLLERSTHMCNSDKYSFCLNITAMPEAQKKMMLQMFKAELESINEINQEDSKIDKTLSSKIIFTQYIQDLYRFFKLFPLKNEFEDIFEQDLDFYNKSFFISFFSDNAILVKLSDFYFESGHYKHAAIVYEQLIGKGLNTQVVFEKAAFAYQQLNQFDKAIDMYKKAELFETTVWILSKIAHCCIKTGDFKQALEYFSEAERLEPDNLKIQLQIANCYLNLDQVETALNHYYKLELLADSNVRVLRPITWCLFILGLHNDAEKYFEMLMKSTEVNKFDLMNYGHWLWCTGQSSKAAEFYIKSINQKNNGFDAFLISFKQDEKYLLQNNIQEDDIALMLDYLEMKYTTLL
ncbi:MAG: tetratricopeptide repeat protein [Bacteroidales bacterium]|nr:tetratricopeptide repeat protein [Bacteroidales bacterium]